LLVGKLGLATGPLSTIATASGLQVQAWRGYWWECSHFDECWNLEKGYNQMGTKSHHVPTGMQYP
jgi:hypothetical protein